MSYSGLPDTRKSRILFQQILLSDNYETFQRNAESDYFCVHNMNIVACLTQSKIQNLKSLYFTQMNFNCKLLIFLCVLGLW